MFESIIYAFALVFILCGMFFVCLLLFDRLMTPKKSKAYYSVVPGFHEDEELPSTVYSAFIRSNLFTFEKRNEVVVLDFGLSGEEKKACSDMLEGLATVIFCTEKEIGELFVERHDKK